jgi:hypothetical protein
MLGMDKEAYPRSVGRVYGMGRRDPYDATNCNI